MTLPTRPHTDGHCYVLITPLCWRDAGIAGMCVVASIVLHFTFICREYLTQYLNGSDGLFKLWR